MTAPRRFACTECYGIIEEGDCWEVGDDCVRCRSSSLVECSDQMRYRCPGNHEADGEPAPFVKGSPGDYCPACLRIIEAHHGDTGSVS